jgi:predicted PurR-regulated permease PerM
MLINTPHQFKSPNLKPLPLLPALAYYTLLKRTLQPVSNEKRQRSSMNLTNTSSFHLKTLRGATQFTGGWVGVPSFLISFGLRVIFSAYLVRTHTVWLTFFSKLLSTGSAVAVERVFSGGRDTISLRRASLRPETIKVLMLVKKKLHLARTRSTAALRK